MIGAKKLFIVVNVDWFFLSHRLPIAIAAKNAGFDITIVSSDSGRSSEIEDYGLKFINAPFTRSGTNILQELLLIRFLRKLYSQHRPDIVHHVTLKPSIYGSIAAGQTGVKNVTNAISGLGYNFTSNRKGLKQHLLNLLLKRGFKSDTLQFIFQNDDDLNIFKKLGLVKNDGQIHLIKGSGVDLNTFRFSPEPNEDKIKILLPARILYDKGVVEFIKAAQTLKDRFADKVCFDLAGDIDVHNPAGIPRDDLNALLAPPYVNWMGHQTAMAQVLTDHNIIVLPSYREGLPKSLIEACAIGRAIITTDAPGCKECVIEGYNGFKVPVKDHLLLAECIERLVVDEQLRKTMGENSRKFAEENFSIESVIQKTLSIYDGFFESH